MNLVWKLRIGIETESGLDVGIGLKMNACVGTIGKNFDTRDYEIRALVQIQFLLALPLPALNSNYPNKIYP